MIHCKQFVKCDKFNNVIHFIIKGNEIDFGL